MALGFACFVKIDFTIVLTSRTSRETCFSFRITYSSNPNSKQNKCKLLIKVLLYFRRTELLQYEIQLHVKNLKQRLVGLYAYRCMFHFTVRQYIFGNIKTCLFFYCEPLFFLKAQTHVPNYREPVFICMRSIVSEIRRICKS